MYAKKQLKALELARSSMSADAYEAAKLKLERDAKREVLLAKALKAVNELRAHYGKDELYDDDLVLRVVD